jgi:small subunit ribosomal protein S18
MPRRYETVYIFDSTLEEPAINDKLTRFHALLTKDGKGTVSNVSHWGKRTMTFKIKKKEVGYYVIAQFEAAGDLLPEYERAVKLDERAAEAGRRGGPRPRRRSARGGGSMRRPAKTCPVCESGARVLDYKDDRTLGRFLTERGKILPSRLSGMCARHQRQLATAIKRARQLALIPYIKGHTA